MYGVFHTTQLIGLFKDKENAYSLAADVIADKETDKNKEEVLKQFKENGDCYYFGRTINLTFGCDTMASISIAEIKTDLE